MTRTKLLDSYRGFLLAAHPKNPQDHLWGSVILVLDYGVKGATGIQINSISEHFSVSDVAENLGMDYSGDAPVFFGGKLSQNRIVVIHSRDWMGMTSIELGEDLAVTTDISVITALCEDQGPERFRACSGHWAWDPGLLPRQIKGDSPTGHRWEATPATADTVFETVGSAQWRRVLAESAHRQINSWFNLFLD